MTIRCQWAGTDPLYVAYHDLEWGVPVHDDRTIFEFLILEGAQAGLSWSTILKKRESYRVAFDNFDPAVVAAYDEAKTAGLPAKTDESRAMSKDLRQRGFTFVGPTICYAHMQATGMV